MADEFRLYRFSPIKGTGSLQTATHYIAQRAAHMARVICGPNWPRECPLASLTVFSHYSDEFASLCDLAKGIGPVVSQNNGPYVDASSNTTLSGGAPLLRIRQPDPYRPHVGCCDFVVPDYKKFKRTYITPSQPFLRVIKRPDFEMVEFFHPDYDVLAYVVNKQTIVA